MERQLKGQKGRKRPQIRSKGEKDRERDKIEVDTHHFVKLNKQIKLGHFRQNITEKVTLQEFITRKGNKKRSPSILLQEKVTKKGYLVYYNKKR